MSPTLYQIGAEFQALEAALIANDGEVTPEIGERLDALDFTEREKVDGYFAVIQENKERIAQINATIAKFQEEIDTLRDNALKYNKTCQVLGETMLRHME